MLIGARTGAFVAGPDKGLPYDAELAWAKGDGACAFLLPFKAEFGYTYTVDYSVSAGATTFGARVSAANANAFSHSVQAITSTVRQERVLIFSADDVHSGYGLALNKRYSSVVDLENSMVKWFDGSTSTLASKSVSGHTCLALFGLANSDGNGMYSFSKPAIYRFTRSKGGVVVNDYAPVLKGDEVFLYDMVGGGELIAKTGTGAFEYELA